MAQQRTCPVCGVTDDSTRHVVYNRTGPDRALHRECCGCDLCIPELTKEPTDG